MSLSLRHFSYTNRVPWQMHLRRVFQKKPDTDTHFLTPWHKHIYRAFQSFRGNPRYAPTKSSFEYFTYKDRVICFDLAFLRDHRGIGRVGRSLISVFRATGLKEVHALKCPTKNAVFFHVSPHWCQDCLPHPNCVMVPDVIPLRFPELFPRLSQEWSERILPIVKQADNIVTISETSKLDIVKFAGVAPEKIKVIYCGVTRLPVANDLPHVLPEKYFVYLGSYDRHKNLQVVFDALSLEGGRMFKLVVIGKQSAIVKSLREMGLDDQVTLFGHLDDGQVGRVLQGATGLVFPSLYEGFGLPPFEAALLGVPSICSRRPSMTELLEGCALFAEPNNPNEWVEAMRLLDTDTPLRNHIASKARAQAETFTWEKSANQLLDILVG